MPKRIACGGSDGLQSHLTRQWSLFEDAKTLALLEGSESIVISTSRRALLVDPDDHATLIASARRALVAAIEQNAADLAEWGVTAEPAEDVLERARAQVKADAE